MSIPGNYNIQVTSQTSQAQSQLAAVVSAINRLGNASVAAAQKAATGFASGMLGGFKQLFTFVAGGTLISKVKQATEATWDFAHEVEEGSKRLGVSVEDFQAWKAVIERTGGAVENLLPAFRNLAGIITDIQAGDTKKLSLFADLGMDASKIGTVQQTFLAITEAYKNSAQGVRQQAALNDLLGRGSMYLLPALKDGFVAAADAIKNSGQVMQTEIIDRMVHARSEAKRLGKAFKYEVEIPFITYLTTSFLATKLIGEIGWAGLKQSFKSMGSPTFIADTALAMKEAQLAIAKRYKEYSESGTADELDATAPKLAPTPNSSYSPPTTDALARIGLFVGGMTGMSANFREMNVTLRSVDQKLDIINDTLEEVL